MKNFIVRLLINGMALMATATLLPNPLFPRSVCSSAFTSSSSGVKIGTITSCVILSPALTL